MFNLRPYQETCDQKLKAHLRSSVDPCLIDAAPAAGKSYLIASIADFLYKVSNGKRVLCLAPSADLVEQNAEKYRLTGEPCSIFSASAGAKSTRHKVVFATPGTVKNSISRFKTGYAGVVVDECHETTPTVREIINAMREGNPMLRVIGFSGTPFVLGKGYVYRIDENGRTLTDDVTRDPYFLKLVHRVSAREMLEQKFICPMDIGQTGSESYDTSNLHLNRLGQFNPNDVDRAFVGHGRKTASIVADIIDKSRGRKGGVMIFGSTVRHAEEIYASLPPSLSGIVTGDPKRRQERKGTVKRYKSGEIRYLVSVGTLHRGFDAPHTEVIALMRKTESATLLQQIMGRAWRLHECKSRSLLLDYASNIEEHFPDGDIYNPVITARAKKKGGKGISAKCPDCSYTNTFSCQEQYLEYPVDENGYCLDVFGSRIETDYGPLSAHYGRRCFGHVPSLVERGKLERCGYRWSGKDCPACGEKNDIAARYCYECKAELVDPNSRLVGEFKAHKRDPHLPQCDVVLSMTCKQSVSQAGNPTLRVDWVTPYRQFSVYFLPDSEKPLHRSAYDKFMLHTDSGNAKPRTISYRKSDSKFFVILDYNQPEDEEPVMGKVA